MIIDEMTTFRIEAERAKCLYAYGKITREEAEEMIKPYLKLANEKGEKIAKRFGMKHRTIKAISFLR